MSETLCCQHQDENDFDSVEATTNISAGEFMFVVLNGPSRISFRDFLFFHTDSLLSGVAFMIEAVEFV